MASWVQTVRRPLNSTPMHALSRRRSRRPRRGGSPPAIRCACARLLKEGLALHPPSPTLLVSAYAKSGLLPDARRLFDETSRRDLRLYSALLAAVSHSSTPALFAEMRRDGVRIDDAFVLSTIIGGAADLAALLMRQLHGFAMRLGFLSSMIVGNALVDMYSKCSDIHSAREGFEEIAVRDVISHGRQLLLGRHSMVELKRYLLFMAGWFLQE